MYFEECLLFTENATWSNLYYGQWRLGVIYIMVSEELKCDILLYI